MNNLEVMNLKRNNVKSHKYVCRRKKRVRLLTVDNLISTLVIIVGAAMIITNAPKAWGNPVVVPQDQFDLVQYDVTEPNPENLLLVDEGPTQTTDIFEEEPLNMMEEVIPTYRDLIIPDENSEEYQMMLKLVEAEVTGDHRDYKKSVTDEEVLLSKVRVARVILNRWASPEWPNTLKGVMKQKHQFTPFSDGRYYDMRPTDLTRKAIEMAFDSRVTTEADSAYYFRMGNGNWRSSNCIYRDAIGVGYYTDC